MYTVKGLDLKKAAKGQATPAANFCVDERNPNIKACQSWNDYVLYQIKSTGKNGKTFCHYEVVKVMRKKTDKGLKTYVIDRMFHSTDVVSACKYMNRLRRFVLPSETQKQIVRDHKNQYTTRWINYRSGKKFGFVALKYPKSVQDIVDKRAAQRQQRRSNDNGGAQGNPDGYRQRSGNGNGKGYRRNNGGRRDQDNQTQLPI